MTEDDPQTLAEAIRRTGAEIGSLRWVCDAVGAFCVPIEELEPVQRNPGVIGLHLDRTERVLHRLMAGADLDPIPTTFLSRSQYRYRIRDGYHRYWIARTCGLTRVPITAREPYDFEA